MRGRSGRELVGPGASRLHAPLFVARGCLYLGTGIANSPCSWCAGNMSPPRLPPGDRRHLLPGHLLHGRTVAGAGVPRCARTGTGDRCGRAALCARGCLYLGTGIANSPCSWCAGNIPPRLPPGDRRHLLPGHLLHGRTVAGAGVPRCARTGTGDRCGRAALCEHGRAMPVTRLRVLPHPVPAV
jgi:hypothetical protein